MEESWYCQCRKAVLHWPCSKEFCFARKVTHKNGKGRVSRNRCEHAQHACGDTEFKDVQNVLKGGEAHTNYHRIYNSVEGFVEVLILVKYEADKKRLAELFYKGNNQKCIQSLINQAMFIRVKAGLLRNGHQKGDQRGDYPVQKTEEKKPGSFALVFVFQENGEPDRNAGANGKAH